MADPMTDRRRAPIEVLERLAEAAIKLDHLLSTTGHFGASERLALNNAAAAYRAAVAPLRTRAVVDAEIAHVARIWSGSHRETDQRWLERLCAEPTQDSGPSSADTEEVPSPRPPVSPAGGLFFDEDLIRRAMDPTVPPGHMRLIISRGAVDVLIEPSGPAGVAAAKESKDNAAAPEGATNEEVEACGCEHTEALLTRLRRIHRICDCYASIDGDRQLEIWTLSDA